MTYYTTDNGDMWDTVSMDVYGTTAYTGKLMMANPEYISEYVFPAGVELNIPDLTEADADLSMLPPWRR